MLRAQPASDRLVLASPPFAACYAGVNYYRAFLAQLRREFPTTDFEFILCCGDDPAIAHDALRLGLTPLRCDCGAEQMYALNRMAEAMGARVFNSNQCP